jgi:hypothetical protein
MSGGTGSAGSAIGATVPVVGLTEALAAPDGLRQNTARSSLTSLERRRYPIAPARRAHPCRWRLSDPDTRCR